MKPLSLYELNSLVRSTLEITFDSPFWVLAELSEVRPSTSGHCYLEFVQKNEGGVGYKAKARATVWRNVYSRLSLRFERETGQRLAAGMKVLASVEVEFHEVYGYSLNVVDIDPSYTLGDMARRRREILEQLRADGVIDLNRELRLPSLVERIAVVSSGTAAGYGDFCNQLQSSPYGFTVKLFPALMQGEGVEESVVSALDSIASDTEGWDVVVIIRGGGAVSDLACFDSYVLAANIAQFPIPVLTGIGHERDDTVADSVAYQKFKTPTAVAAFLIETRREEADRIEQLATRLSDAATAAVGLSRNLLDRLALRFSVAAAAYVSRQRNRLSACASRVAASATSRIASEKLVLASRQGRIAAAVSRRFLTESHRLDMASKSLTLSGPQRILSLGYSITIGPDGKAVSDISRLKTGDRITTRLFQGEISSDVVALKKGKAADAGRGHNSKK